MDEKLSYSQKGYAFWVTVLYIAILAIGNHFSYRFFYPWKKSPTGFVYKSMRGGNKKQVHADDWVELKLVCRRADSQVRGKIVRGKELLNTQRYARPFFVKVSDIALGPTLREMLCIARENQRIIFKWSSHDLKQLGYSGLEAQLREPYRQLFNDNYILDVTIDKVMNEQEYQQMQEKLRHEQTERDKKSITQYLEKNNIKTSSTSQGVFFLTEQDGEGDLITKDKMVKINFTYRLLDGPVITTNVETVARENNLYREGDAYEAVEVAADTKALVPGVDEVFLSLKKAQKARLFIPVGLVFGLDAEDRAPENSVLVLDMEIVDVYDKADVGDKADKPVRKK